MPARSHRTRQAASTEKRNHDQGEANEGEGKFAQTEFPHKHQETGVEAHFEISEEKSRRTIRIIDIKTAEKP